MSVTRAQHSTIGSASDSARHPAQPGHGTQRLLPALFSAITTVFVLSTAVACGHDSARPDAAEMSLVPADYSSYVEVRSCRSSPDHDLERVRVLVEPSVVEIYLARDPARSFAPGSIILKEERDSADVDCAGPIDSWAVMRKLEDGSSPGTLDFDWQRVGAAFGNVITEDKSRCYGCHANCVMPDFYEYTCTKPP